MKYKSMIKPIDKKVFLDFFKKKKSLLDRFKNKTIEITAKEILKRSITVFSKKGEQGEFYPGCFEHFMNGWSLDKMRKFSPEHVYSDQYSILHNYFRTIKKSVSSKKNITVELLTEYEDFLRLGNYEIDKGSCFKEKSYASGRRMDKRYLAVKHGSFVLLVKIDGKIYGRCFGIVKNRENIFISNCYPRTSTEELMLIVTLAFERKFKKKYKNIDPYPRDYSETRELFQNVYLNGDTAILRYKK